MGRSTSAASCLRSGCASRGNLADAIRSWVAESGPSAPHLVIGHEPDGWHTMPEVAIQRSYSRTPGVLYVGDAMGTIEPLTGQGMTMALASARLAASHLLAAGAVAVDRAGQSSYRAGLARPVLRHDPRLALDGLAAASSAHPVGNDRHGPAGPRSVAQHSRRGPSPLAGRGHAALGRLVQGTTAARLQWAYRDEKCVEVAVEDKAEPTRFAAGPCIAHPVPMDLRRYRRTSDSLP